MLRMKLYELASDYQQVSQLIDDPDTDLSVIQDTLESIEAAVEIKASNIVQFVQSLETDAEIIKAEEKRLANRRKAIENRARGIKEYLQAQMERAGISKVKTPTVTISLQNNPPKVDVLDLTMLPSEYVEQHIDFIPRKKELAAALKAGKEIPGARLVNGKSLRIR